MSVDHWIRRTNYLGEQRRGAFKALEALKSRADPHFRTREHVEIDREVWRIDTPGDS
jgi:hypothetical protein